MLVSDLRIELTVFFLKHKTQNTHAHTQMYCTYAMRWNKVDNIIHPIPFICVYINTW